MAAERQVERERHHRQVHEQREAQADELAQEELVAAQGLGQEGEERSPLDLLADQADADEDGDERAEELHGGEADVLEDLLVLADGELAEQEAGQGHEDREEDQVVEHPLAHGLPEGVGGYRQGTLQSSNSQGPALEVISLTK